MASQVPDLQGYPPGAHAEIVLFGLCFPTSSLAPLEAILAKRTRPGRRPALLVAKGHQSRITTKLAQLSCHIKKELEEQMAAEGPCHSLEITFGSREKGRACLGTWVF